MIRRSPDCPECGQDAIVVGTRTQCAVYHKPLAVNGMDNPTSLSGWSCQSLLTARASQHTQGDDSAD